MTLDRGWRTIVCAATGPSFSEDQAAIIAAAKVRKACRVIAVNDNYRRLPGADVLFAADRSWWRLHVNAVRGSGFPGELWTVQQKAAQAYGLHCVRHKHEKGLNREPGTVNSGANSGYMAMGLAYLFGAKTIILAGYDMGKAADGANHWFGRHAGTLSNNSPYGTFVKRFGPLADDLSRAGVAVVNASSSSALQCFPRADLAQTLTALPALA